LKNAAARPHNEALKPKGERTSGGNPPRTTQELPERAWRISAAVILAVAAALRLAELALKPLHHDEGVNGVFLLKLVRDGVYHYDPSNYHGPTLYYFARVAAWVDGLFTGGSGLSDVSIRLVPALFGIATVALVLCLRRELGKRGSLAAAAFIAVSPGTVFYSRYFIHETLFVFFAVAMAACCWLAVARARPAYLYPASVSAALLFATKETALISAASLVLAAAVQYAFLRYRKLAPTDRPLQEMWERIGGWPRGAIHTGLGVVLFVCVFVLFYSSFFQNPQGVHDAIESLQIWTKTGVTEVFYPKYAYVTWIWRQEWPMLVVAALGILTVLVSPRGFGALAGIWGGGLLVAYTLIPYKTPWLALSFTIPLAIAGGHGVGREWEQARGAALHVVRGAGAILLAVLLYQSVSLNFVHYDDRSEPYVYLHTTRAIRQLVRGIEAAAARSGQGDNAAITITAPEYWPLPWYLRRYRRAGYWGTIVTTDAPAVVGSLDQERELAQQLGPSYRFAGAYILRPDVTLVLFVKR
jgi:uncharacterized protein (TIGR03663 family)